MNPETKQKAVKSSHNWKLNALSTHNNQWLPEEMAEELRKNLGMSKIPQSQMRVTLRGSPAVELTGNSGTPQKTGNRVHLKALLHEDQTNPGLATITSHKTKKRRLLGKQKSLLSDSSCILLLYLANIFHLPSLNYSVGRHAEFSFFKCDFFHLLIYV